MKTEKLIIIHGNWGSTGEDAWIPWVKQEVEKLGLAALAPTMPDNHEAKMAVWLPYIENELKADEGTVIIGWSSGAVAAMRYAETHKLKGSILVGACHTDLGEELEKVSGYYDVPWNWEAIQKNQEWIVQFGSSDDPAIPVAESRFVHQHLRCEYHEYTDRQHFGYPTEMKEFPEIIEVLKRKLNR